MAPTTIEIGGEQNQTRENWSNFNLLSLHVDNTDYNDAATLANSNPTSSATDAVSFAGTGFSDNFQDVEQSKKNWIVNENGGSVHFQPGAICLKDDPPDFNFGLKMQGRYYD